MTMTVDTLREEAGISTTSGPGCTPAPRTAGDGNEPPVTRRSCSGDRRLPPTSSYTKRPAGRGPALTGTNRVPVPFAATWTPCHCTRTPGSTSAAERRNVHACGHDTHVAMRAGAPLLSAWRRDPGSGAVRSNPVRRSSRARFMLDEGLLDVPPRRRHAIARDGAFAPHHVVAADRLGELPWWAIGVGRRLSSTSSAAGRQRAVPRPSILDRLPARLCRRSDDGDRSPTCSTRRWSPSGASVPAR
jgi:hypothetical protein